MRIDGQTFSVSGLVNVAGTTDTVLRDFGATLLTPATGKGFSAAALEIRRRLRGWGDPRCLRYDYPLQCNVGLRMAASATTRRWATATTPAADGAGESQTVTVTRAIDVPMYAIDLGASYEFFHGIITSSDSAARAASMRLDLGLARRAIRGTFGSKRATAASLRESLLHSRQRTFEGGSAALALTYGQIHSEFTYLWLNGSVDGVSGGQIIAAVGLRAALVSGLFKRE